MKDKYQPENCKCDQSEKCLPRPPRGTGSIVLPGTAGPRRSWAGGPWHPDAGPSPLARPRPGASPLAEGRRFPGTKPTVSPGARAQRCCPSRRGEAEAGPFAGRGRLLST